MFSYENFEKPVVTIPGMSIEVLKYNHGISKFDLTLSALESSGQLFLSFEYSTELFTRNQIERFAGYFRKIVSSVAKDIHQKISDIDILSNEERHLQMVTYNNTHVEVSQGTVLDLFERQVQKTPDQIALYFGNETMTYRSLYERAIKVATYLTTVRGIKKGELVGLMISREEYVVPSIYGILWAGGVYVPIAPDFPPARIKTMIGEAGIKVLITRSRYLKEGIAETIDVIDLDRDLDSLNGSVMQRPDVSLQGQDLAYVMFTSGSTGIPKGVMIEHHALLNTIECLQSRYPLEAGDRFLLKTSCSFDVSLAELFGWMPAGGALCLLPEGDEGDPYQILAAISRYGITHINFVPSMFVAFVEILAQQGIEQISSV